MPLLLLVIQLFIVLCPSFAQTETDVVGKWYFESIRREDEAEPISRTAMEFVVGKNSFKQFMDDHRFVTYDNKKYNYGTWTWIAKRNQVMMISDDGNIFRYDITHLVADTMMIHVPGRYVGFIKAHDSLAQDKPANALTTPTVRATTKQIAKKWTLSEVISPSKQVIDPTSLLKGSWYDFKTDGTYVRRYTQEFKGTWQFADDGHSLITIDENGIGAFWSIIEVSDKKLVLQALRKDAKRVYTCQ